MTWVKLDDQFFRNPKARAAGKDGRALFLAGLCYCASALTDGFIADNAIKMVVADAEVRVTVTDRLTAVGLWHRVDGGWMVNDFRKYNRAAAEVRKDRDEGKERAARSRERKANQTRTYANGSPDPSRPVPTYNPLSSTSDLRPSAEPVDDEQRVHATLKAITDRRIVEHAAGPVPNMAGYRRAVAAGVAKDFKPSAYLLARQHPDWLPERLAVTLDPPAKPSLAVVAVENTRLGGIAQWLAEGVGA